MEKRFDWALRTRYYRRTSEFVEVIRGVMRFIWQSFLCRWSADKRTLSGVEEEFRNCNKHRRFTSAADELAVSREKTIGMIKDRGKKFIARTGSCIYYLTKVLLPTRSDPYRRVQSDLDGQRDAALPSRSFKSLVFS